jgi:hypothetical protein
LASVRNMPLNTKEMSRSHHGRCHCEGTCQRPVGAVAPRKQASKIIERVRPESSYRKSRENSDPIGNTPDRNMARKHLRESAYIACLIRAKILASGQSPVVGLVKHISANKKGMPADSRGWANAVQIVPGQTQRLIGVSYVSGRTQRVHDKHAAIVGIAADTGSYPTE